MQSKRLSLYSQKAIKTKQKIHALILKIEAGYVIVEIKWENN